MNIILIVDDEDIVRKLIRLALRDLDVDCIEATDSEEALAISKRYRGPIDLLLSDVMMPGSMNGAEMALKFSDARPEARVLLMSGYSVQAVKMKAGWGFVPKPFGAADIRDEVRRMLGQSVERQLRRAG